MPAGEAFDAGGGRGCGARVHVPQGAVAAPGCGLASFRAGGKDVSQAGGAPRLERDGNGLFLTDGVLELRAGFSHLACRMRSGRLQGELVVRAAKVKGCGRPLSALDATAGLGEDSFLLAAAGFTVDLYERDPTIAALLSDALGRASGDPVLCEAASRMRLHERDSIPAMRHLDAPPDVVVLDPMFPARRKSAAVKKKFQLLQRLEAPCDGGDEEALLDAAFAAGPRKIVVKRPAKGAPLAGRKPDYSLSGKAVRYDCYLPARRRSRTSTLPNACR